MTNIKRLTKAAIRSHKIMRTYYEKSVSWGRGSMEKLNVLERVMKNDTRFAIEEIESTIKDLERVKEVLQQFNHSENTRPIDATDIHYNKETGFLQADVYGMKYTARI